MKRYFVIALSLILCATCWAKRGPEPQVDPVIIGQIKIIAPNDNGFKGYVVATDVSSNEKLWEKKIFKVWKNPFVEEDVQWVFIKSMSTQNGKVIITDERDRKYSLHPKTKKVKKLKEKKK